MQKMFMTYVNELGYLVSKVKVYNKLIDQLIPIAGYGDRTFEFLLKGDEGVAAVIDMLESTRIVIGHTEEKIEVKDTALNIITNLMVSQNLATGFSIEEYNKLVRYIVKTSYRCIAGQLTNKDDYYYDETNNREMENAIRYISRYPYILTMIAMENLVIENKKEG